jgi:Flp pilus assembly protein CpaB
LADIAPGEPIVSSRLANKRNGGGLGIPSGMRAVSVQVSDSSGVVALLKPGLRVDVQAVYSRSGANQDAEIRTVLENIEVLKINPAAEPAPGRPALPVATLLVTPAEADTVGLADAVARVRLVLRNPLDQDKVQRSTIGVAGLMRGSAAPVQAVRVAAPPVVPVARAAASGLSLATAADPAACNPPK